MNVGIVGFGFVGKGVAHTFSHLPLKIYDKFGVSPNTIEETVDESDVLFICVPTPMDDDGRQDLSSVEDAIKSIVDTATSPKTIVLRTTITPGTTKHFAEMFPAHCFVFMPEFLTERTYIFDSLNPTRIVIGGEIDSTGYKDVVSLFNERFPSIKIFKLTWEGAELSKYMNNCFSAVKISFMNELYDIASNLDVTYESVREILVASGWVGDMHTHVPGPDGDWGFGGKCLVSGTAITMSDGSLKNIEDIVVGDLVFDGVTTTKVTGVDKRVVDNTVKISSRGRNLTGSDDHLQVIYNLDNDTFSEKEFKYIEDGDYIYIPKPPTIYEVDNVDVGVKPNNYVKLWHSHPHIDSDVARLIGLYIAEGCSGVYSNKHEVIWSFGEVEEHIADFVVETLISKFKLNPYKRLQVTNGTFGESRCWVVRCRSMWLYTFFSVLGLGTNALNKNAPIFNNTLSKSMIGGWLDGDGSLSGYTISGYSESTELIKTIDFLLLRLGINASVGRKGKEIKISMRDDVEKVSKWTSRLKFNKKLYKTDNRWSSTNMRSYKNGWLSKISKINLSGGEQVFSMETESHVYVANNILTHNCLPKDLASFIVWSEDNGMFTDMCKAAKKVNTRIRKDQNWLNIKGATSANNYKE